MGAAGILVPQKFLMQPGIPTETAVRVYKRYLRLEPSHTEEYVAYLKSKARTPCIPSNDHVSRDLL